MGVKNFKTYAVTFLGTKCFREFNVHHACYNIKDFSRHEMCVNADLVEANRTSYDSSYYRSGVYIDLSSYMYGCMMKSIENTEQFERIMSSVGNENETKTVICDLDRGTIDRIVNDCKETLIRALEPLLLKAYRVYLAYDTFQPKAKFFEQNMRRKKMHFSLSSVSRETCHEGIVRHVKNFVVEAHMKVIEEQHANHYINHGDIRRQIETKLFPYDSNRFTMGEGEWKCFYQMSQDITDSAVDVCFVFGRDWDIGLAMTMYQHPSIPNAIRYVYGPNDSFEHTKLFDHKERMLHFISLALFGNDYVGRLVNLSDSNAAFMKKELDKMYSGDAGACTTEHVEYLSSSLFTNRSLSKSAEEETNVEKREKFSRAFATIVVRLLAAVYGDARLQPDVVENVLHYAGIGPFSDRPGPDGEALKLREYLSNRRKENEQKQSKEPDLSGIKWTGTREKSTDESTMLTCRDARGHQVMRTLQQCMDSFALGTLWYLSYATFYFRSPTGRDRLKTAKQTEDLPMIMGMCMGHKGSFRYNDERLTYRYDLCRLLELKRTLQNIKNCCLLYWVVESSFARAFDLE